MNSIKKVLILQDTLSSYNEAVYEILSEKYDLTLAYANKLEFKGSSKFKIVKLECTKFLNIIYIKNSFFKYCEKFDVVIFSADLHYFSFCLLPFLSNKSFKTISWTLGIRASYKLRYDLVRKKKFLDYLYGIVLKKCDALIFYMSQPIDFWGNFLKPENIFVAHNTIKVNTQLVSKNVKKDTLLFVGTLYKEKKIYELLNAFLIAKNNNSTTTTLKLEIIGDGVEFNNIIEFIKDNNLENYVLLRGKISNETELAEAFNRSILCISPDQAGLSVLMSMGYGVPFVTRMNAITGGERLNILNGENGILYMNEINLIEILTDAYLAPEKYSHMGIKAQDYYINHATIDMMALGFEQAIEYVTVRRQVH
jgi:glycosyltransferase involved in cell wall biosynthesis